METGLRYEAQTSQSSRNYLYGEINARLQRHRRLARRYRKTSFAARLAVVIISSLTTVAAGLKLSSSDWASVSPNVVLLLSATNTVVAVALTFYTPLDAWRLHERTRWELRALRAKAELSAFTPRSDEEERKLVAEYFDEYQQILDNHLKDWLKMRDKNGGRGPEDRDLRHHESKHRQDNDRGDDSSEK